MNKLKKIGLTALAGSLVATSVFAGEMSVSGSAAITFAGQDKKTIRKWLDYV
jgi:outer membrane protein OmpU